MNSRLSRRSFLRSAGAVLTLPFLEALAPRKAHSAEPSAPPRRMVCIMTNTGLIPENFFPKMTGRDYEATRYMTLLAQHRQNMTLIGGVSHPDNSGGHMVEKSFSHRRTFSIIPFIQKHDLTRPGCCGVDRSSHPFPVSCAGCERKARWLALGYPGRHFHPA